MQLIFTDLIQINYTPNFITFACKFSKGRSKTFLFIRFKKNFIQLEFSGQVKQIHQVSEFSQDVISELKIAFNNLSEKQL
jgi:hypothetical protein